MLEPVDDDTRPAKEPRKPQDEPVATYLDVGEEWQPSFPERAETDEPVLPSVPDPQPQGSVPGVQRGVAPPSQYGRGHVRGVARSVQVRSTDTSTSVLSFRIDQFDASGNRVQPVGVELQGYRSGQLSDGEDVDVMGRWKGGTLRANRVINRTTGAHIKGLPPWTQAAGVIIIGCAACFIVVVWIILLFW